jgi:membrane-associated protein
VHGPAKPGLLSGNLLGTESPTVHWLNWFIDVVLHLDAYMKDWSQTMGPWLYLLLFLVLFCETGLVVMPFLPGDSLLFTVGAVAALDGSPVHIALILPLLIVAAVAGDAVNYSIGRRLGPKVFARENSRLLNKRHLMRTKEFYDRHGGKTIVIARFAPILRTFAPFVAGIGQMQYRRFAMFNVSGGIAWVASFLMAGYFFGGLETVKRNFHIIIIVIVFISLLPTLFEVIRAWLGKPKPSDTKLDADKAPETDAV